jgi:excinuclease ABC subunit C
MRDDKSFAMLEITRTDDFPKVRVVHETEPVCGERIGPFPSASDLREAVRILQGVFRFATCSLEIREGDPRWRHFRPCLLASIGRCSAPCAMRISKEEYARSIESFRRFVLGDREAVIREIEREMRAAAARLEYERAAELRDRARALRALGRRSGRAFAVGDITPIHPEECLEDLRRLMDLSETPRRIEGVDIATLGGAAAVGSLVCFLDGVPFKDGYRRYRIRTVRGMDDFAMIREVVSRRARRWREEWETPPDVFLVDGGIGQLRAAAAALDADRPRVLAALAKREEALFVEGREGAIVLGRERPALRLLMYVRDEAHRFAQHYHHILRRKAVLPE